MSKTVYRYEFCEPIEIAEVEGTLVLAIIATEALHGETATQLGIAHLLDRKKCACIIDVSSEVGSDFNSLFLGFLRREFGADAFRARRVAALNSAPAVAA